MAETNSKSLKIHQRLTQPSLCENTKVKILDFVYEWNIENLEDVLNRKYEIHSPVFACDKCDRIKWKLVLYKTHEYPEGAHMSVSLIKMSEDMNPYNVLYSLSILDEFGKIYRLRTREKTFTKFLDFDAESIIKHTELIKNKFFVDKSLKIRCEMNIFTTEIMKESLNQSETSTKNLSVSECNLLSLSTKYEEGKKKSLSIINKLPSANSYNIIEDIKLENCMQNSISSPNSLNGLSDNLTALYTSKSYSDITIMCGNQEIRAHKAIITARSDYFKNMCTEFVGDKIYVDAKKDVMDIVLFYLYSGKIPQVPMDLALDLLIAAEKFHMLPLQESAIKILKSNLTVDNVIDILQFSERLKLSELKIACLLFANKHHTEIVQTEKWKKMIKDNPHVAGKVLLAVASFQETNLVGNVL